MILEEIKPPDPSDIANIMAKLKVKKYTVNDDGSVDVNGTVKIPRTMTSFPVQFGKINGDFICLGPSTITSLKGAPHTVEGSFIISTLYDLTSLKGGPQAVGGSYDCRVTGLTSLEGAASSVGGTFNCSGAAVLKSLKGGPQAVGNGYFCGDTEITSLEGAPHTVGGPFNCCRTPITSLNGAPQSIGDDFTCFGMPKLKSLHGIHKTHKNMVVGGSLFIDAPVTHILGLAMIPGINTLYRGGVRIDMSHHDALQFQEELIDAGFTQQARL